MKMQEGGQVGGGGHPCECARGGQELAREERNHALLGEKSVLVGKARTHGSWPWFGPLVDVTLIKSISGFLFSECKKMDRHRDPHHSWVPAFLQLSTHERCVQKSKQVRVEDWVWGQEGEGTQRCLPGVVLCYRGGWRSVPPREGGEPGRMDGSDRVASVPTRKGRGWLGKSRSTATTLLRRPPPRLPPVRGLPEMAF